MLTPNPAKPPPHHGFIAALGIGQIISWGSMFYSFPLIATPLGEMLGLGKQAVYAAATIGLLVASVTAMAVGRAIDRGYGRQVMSVGSVLGGALLMALTVLDSAFWLYPVFIGLGVAQAMTLYEPAFAVVARRFGAKGARQGITALTLWGGFAGTVFVPLLQGLIELYDWKVGLLVLGASNILLAAGLYGWFIQPHRDHDTSKPATRGPQQAGPAAETVRQALRRPVFWALTLSLTFYHLGSAGLLFHLFPALLEQGYTTAATVTAFACLGPSQVTGRVVIMLFAAHRPVRFIGMAVVTVIPLSMVLLLLPPHFALLVAFALVFGSANGVMTIVRGLVVPEMVSPQAYGTLNGIIAVPTAIAKAVAPLALAWVWGLSNDYGAVLWACAGASAASGLAFWLAAGLRNR